jgi:hypothetical protein
MNEQNKVKSYMLIEQITWIMKRTLTNIKKQLSHTHLVGKLHLCPISLRRVFWNLLHFLWSLFSFYMSIKFSLSNLTNQFIIVNYSFLTMCFCISKLWWAYLLFKLWRCNPYPMQKMIDTNFVEHTNLKHNIQISFLAYFEGTLYLRTNSSYKNV